MASHGHHERTNIVAQLGASPAESIRIYNNKAVSVLMYAAQLLEPPAWLLLSTLSVLSPKKWGLAISSKHVTILIESCKSADNLGNYCRNAFAVNFNFCLTDLISLKCKKGKKVCSRYCKNFSQNERGKGLASVRFIEARTINILCLALSCVLCPVYNNSFFIF